MVLTMQHERPLLCLCVPLGILDLSMCAKLDAPVLSVLQKHFGIHRIDTAAVATLTDHVHAIFRIIALPKLHFLGIRILADPVDTKVEWLDLEESAHDENHARKAATHTLIGKLC